MHEPLNYLVTGLKPNSLIWYVKNLHRAVWIELLPAENDSFLLPKDFQGFKTAAVSHSLRPHQALWVWAHGLEVELGFPRCACWQHG